jgi:hypothetical protein
MDEIGNRRRATRRGAGLTLKEIATKVGVITPPSY